MFCHSKRIWYSISPVLIQSFFLYSRKVLCYFVNLVKNRQEYHLWDLALAFTPFDIQKYMLTFRNLGLVTPYPGLALVFLEEEKIKQNSSAKTFVILKCKYGDDTNLKGRFISSNFSSKR